jgi:hypothetical protein
MRHASGGLESEVIGLGELLDILNTDGLPATSEPFKLSLVNQELFSGLS